ncbi:hypothetical protein W97_03524 [Coniosporium apollinis CBS 100218]|uniref:Cytochrome c oxidase assembly factor 3 n=1 Tax=Coniosporium apollinis (strain CBS 100218) TaxID=1168221 RepID=R7YR06_CONA1|nr:uncharacterized protein W97_03524 [Coniosporium apollinis CBS 100218]EON64293.1 hypothetical protein W97_03524 [Coniosporium apollinis CBS 100218]
MPIPRSSYYDRDYKQSPALIRARQPYLVKNIVTGAAIFGFAIGVYAFTIRAVAQDEFEDVIVPDKPVQPAHAPNAEGNNRTLGSAPLSR